MAIKINGKKASTGVASKHVTLPICGMYIAKTKANDAFTLYIDHWTCADKIHRAYKSVFIHTKDPETPFGRLCKAFKVFLPSSVTQQAAAELLAAAVAEYGALRCVRSGKKQEWLDIHPVQTDGDALPWGFPSKDGMLLKSLWNPDEGSSSDESVEGVYTIIGKDFQQVVDDIFINDGIPVLTLLETLERESAMTEGVSIECHSKLSALVQRAVDAG